MLAALVIVPTAGCENWSSIYRTAKLDEGDSLITDAKQRVVLNVRDSRPSRDGHRIVCAEPSPDVAQAFQAALQAGAAVSNGDTRVNANLALATASQIAQLGERLASIQLMRDRMYRACEAYANGATTQGGYISMLARVDKTMGAMLGMEMAAGAFGRQLAATQGSASVSGADSATVAAARDAVKDATKSFEAARDTYAKATTGTDAKAQAAEALSAAASTLDTRATALVNLEVGSALAAGGGPAGGGAGAPGAISARPADASAANAVVAVHRNFIDDDGIDGIVDACVSELSRERYAYDDFLKLAKDHNLYVAPKPRRYGADVSQAAADEIARREEAAAVTSYQAHFERYMKIRQEFTNYCMSSVLGNETGKQSPFIAQRLASKERLRVIAEKSAIIQQCAPVLSNKAPSASEKVLQNYCVTAMKN